MVQSNGRALLKRIVCASDGSKLPAAIEFDEFDLPSLKKEDNCHCAAHIFLRFLFCSTLRWYAGPGRMKVLEVPDSFMGVLFFCFLAPRSSIFCAILLLCTRCEAALRASANAACEPLRPDAPVREPGHSGWLAGVVGSLPCAPKFLFCSTRGHARDEDPRPSHSPIPRLARFSLVARRRCQVLVTV